MKKYNACISVISSRSKCLPLCLKSLWDNWNYKYNYPVYVYYFDDIYDDENYRQQIRNFSKGDIRFISVPYETPKHIPESELFYNQKHLWYVNTGRFGKHRKGYLHMCHFMSNFYGYPNTEFEKYDYAMSIDDESQFLKEPPHDFFEEIDNRPEMMGALKVVDQTKKIPHQGNFDTRVDLWDTVKKFIKDNNIIPASKFIKNLLEDSEADKNFHFYPVCDSYVIKLDMFKMKEWKMWIDTINSSGGIYKYRWGDNDIVSLFHLIFFEHDIYDFKTVDEGYHNQGGFRNIQSIAPNIKDFDR